MTYTYKKSNGLARIIYLALFIVGCVLACLELQGYYRVVFTTLGMGMVMAAIVLFLRYESTEYSLVLRENKTDYDFFVNKTVGKQSAYACYFYVSTTVDLVKYESKSALTEKYPGIEFYFYIHNIKPKDRYAIIFQYNDGGYVAIVVQMGEDMLNEYQRLRSIAKPIPEEPEVDECGTEEDLKLGTEAISSVTVEAQESAKPKSQDETLIQEAKAVEEESYQE